MKKLAALTALVMLTGALNTVPASADDGKVDIGQGWSVTLGSKGVLDETHYAEITNEDSHTGDYSLHFSYPDNYAGTSVSDPFMTIEHEALGTRWLEVGWDHPVNVEMYMKSDTASYWSDAWNRNFTLVGVFDCMEDNGSGTFVRLNMTKVTIGEPDENGWRKVSYSYKYPYGVSSDADTDAGHIEQEKKAKFRILLRGMANDVWVDDIRVTYAGTNTYFRNAELLSNGDFEPMTETGEALENYGWWIDTDASTMTGDPVAKIVKDNNNNRMLYVESPAKTSTDTSEKILVLRKDIITDRTVINWNDYEIHFKIKGRFGSNALYLGNGANLNGSDLSGISHLIRFANSNVTMTPLEGGWYQVKIPTKGINQTNAMSVNTFRMEVRGYAEGFYVDDFAVVKLDDDGTTPVKGDHIFNGTFDNELTEAEIEASSWNKITSYARHPRFKVTRSTQNAYSGDSSMFMSTTGGTSDQAIQFNQTLPEDFDYSQDHTLKFKMKTLRPDSTMYVYYGDSTDLGQIGDVLNVDTNDFTVEALGDDWYQYTGTLSGTLLADEAKKLAFEASYGLDGVWIDDVSLTDEDGKEYIVNGGFDTYNAVEIIDEPYFTDGMFDSEELVEGENYLTTKLYNYKKGQDFILYFAIYKDGNLFRVVSASAMDAEVGEITLEAYTELDTVSDGVYTAKGFLWNDSMDPYLTASLL